jgi:hypothetical protein
VTASSPESASPAIKIDTLLDRPQALKLSTVGDVADGLERHTGV